MGWRSAGRGGMANDEASTLDPPPPHLPETNQAGYCVHTFNPARSAAAHRVAGRGLDQGRLRATVHRDAMGNGAASLAACKERPYPLHPELDSAPAGIAPAPCSLHMEIWFANLLPPVALAVQTRLNSQPASMHACVQQLHASGACRSHPIARMCACGATQYCPPPAPRAAAAAAAVYPPRTLPGVILPSASAPEIMLYPILQHESSHP